jgi:hypothetical protein
MFKRAEIYLTSFSLLHIQLYVAYSRESSFATVPDAIIESIGNVQKTRLITSNIGYREVPRCFETYVLTPHSTALLEKLTGFQLLKKFSAFY